MALRTIATLVAGAASIETVAHIARTFQKQQKPPLTKALLDKVPRERKFWAGVLGVVTCVAGFALYRKYKNRPVKIRMAGQAVEESLVAGSTLVTRPIPSCQAAIGFKEPDGMKVVGCCIRTEFGLWVPLHVVSVGYENAYIIGRTGVVYPIGEQISKALQHPFGLEMICLDLPSSWYSQLELKIAVFSPMATYDTVCITGPDGKSSMGRLQITDPNFYIMGKVEYHGSTTAGFSGAPYMRGPHVIGIHLHGGSGGNGGQEILYLNHMYKLEMQILPEASISSEDSGQKLLTRFMTRKDELLAHQVGDDVVLRDETGHYHRTKVDTYEIYLRAKKQHEAEPLDWGAEMDVVNPEYYNEESIPSFLVKRRAKPLPTATRFPASTTSEKEKRIRSEKQRLALVRKHEKALLKLSAEQPNISNPRPCTSQTIQQEESLPLSETS